jgi:D-hexose-6-phosphate mutarotase
LHAHVEKTVGRNLQNRCSTALKTAVEGAEQEMEGQSTTFWASLMFYFKIEDIWNVQIEITLCKLLNY